jgi:REP element-mobilizing transposase RayT
MFELFDPRQEYVVRQGTLPHWYQPGVTYFVTFRTEDSVPQPLLRSWHLRRDDWLRQHGIDPAKANWKARLAAVPELDREYHARFTRAFMDYLDRGYGACVLRDQRAAELVAGALHHFDGDRYHLDDFIVMPNHVHLLVCLVGATEIEAQCHSWKKYSAGQINRLLGQSGRFWQEESFDHLVRSPEQFERLEQYIAENPEKAGLREGAYLHWVRPKNVVGTLRVP